MRVYAPDYSQAALDALLAASRRRRLKALNAVARLCDEPSLGGDFQKCDPEGRVWEVLLVWCQPSSQHKLETLPRMRSAEAVQVKGWGLRLVAAM